MYGFCANLTCSSQVTDGNDFCSPFCANVAKDSMEVELMVCRNKPCNKTRKRKTHFCSIKCKDEYIDKLPKCRSCSSILAPQVKTWCQVCKASIHQFSPEDCVEDIGPSKTLVSSQDEAEKMIVVPVLPTWCSSNEDALSAHMYSFDNVQLSSRDHHVVGPFSARNVPSQSNQSSRHDYHTDKYSGPVSARRHKSPRRERRICPIPGCTNFGAHRHPYCHVHRTTLPKCLTPGCNFNIYPGYKHCSRSCALTHRTIKLTY